eukprot:CAMPEP_0201878088 /NCGR_PEP_ID=MMETSP0902-20130614/9347_1 /ASSEMBLY_ACC=CAM_ASM_000551 /TAXON_ID=420261 /ORGANISM="Thalassiosira antarctica, Strain CCMP982" /LENGTH=50 /DNA_ID=CAMNT_0048405677 /DNA_START=177 /DNA_END=326 /DNA_ORIENTATION=-
MMLKVKVINEGMRRVKPLILQQLLDELLFDSVIVDVEFYNDNVMFIEMIM